MVTDVLTRHTPTPSALAPVGPCPRSATGWLAGGAVVMFAPAVLAFIRDRWLPPLRRPTHSS